MSALPNANSNMCSTDCDSLSEYCDSFNGQCRPCSDLCNGPGHLRDCQDKCEAYVKSQIFHSTHLQPSVTDQELKRIQIMLVAIMAACLVILVLLAALVVFKCQAKRSKRRQLLRRSQPNEVVPMAQFQPRGGSGHSLGASSSTTTRPESSLALPRFPNSESSTRLGHAKSLQTMTTHLSDLELGSQGLSTVSYTHLTLPTTPYV